MDIQSKTHLIDHQRPRGQAAGRAGGPVQRRARAGRAPRLGVPGARHQARVLRDGPRRRKGLQRRRQGPGRLPDERRRRRGVPEGGELHASGAAAALPPAELRGEGHGEELRAGAAAEPPGRVLHRLLQPGDRRRRQLKEMRC